MKTIKKMAVLAALMLIGTCFCGIATADDGTFPLFKYKEGGGMHELNAEEDADILPVDGTEFYLYDDEGKCLALIQLAQNSKGQLYAVVIPERATAQYSGSGVRKTNKALKEYERLYEIKIPNLGQKTQVYFRQNNRLPTGRAGLMYESYYV